MLEFKRKELSIKLYGEEYKLTFPSVYQVETYQDTMKDSKKTEFEMAREFLFDLGLPIECSKSMHIEDFKRLIDVLLGQKKS